MAITTVLGEIENSELGVAMSHEHLLIDLRQLVDKPTDNENTVFYKKVNLKNRHYIYSDPYAMLDNAIIDNEKVLLQELKLYKEAGGESIVDVTLKNIGRNPKALRRLSQKSNVNIIMGCGEYLGVTHSSFIKEKTTNEIAKLLIEEITTGVDGTGIKAGVIGEIGTSAAISENEIKCLEAAGIASIETGKGIHIHTSLWEKNGLQVSDLLIKLGVLPSKIAINHIDVDLRESYILQLLDKGVYVEFDNFGKEFYIPKRAQGILKGRFAYDLERCQLIKKIIDKGYINQILLTNDICLKSMLASYGGNGYGHIINNIVPMLNDCDIKNEEIDKILRNNVLNFLG